MYKFPALILVFRELERPIIHRYKEIEEFPKALNVSQMWNWSTRLFITEAQQNITRDETEGLPAKYTKEEIASLEKLLIEHETWLNLGVEKQKATAFNDDPAIETSEMKKRGEELAKRLQTLMQRKTPRPKKTTTSRSSSSTSSASAKETSSPQETTPSSSTPSDKHDEL